MTAKELCDDLGAARQDQFGSGPEPAEVFPSKYFNYSVMSIDPSGGTTQRAPKYCATNPGATAIANLLTAKLVMGNAIVFQGLGGSFSDTEAVPWLVFSDANGKDSKPVNAGVMLDYFNHASYPATVMEAEQALANAQFEIKGAFA